MVKVALYFFYWSYFFKFAIFDKLVIEFRKVDLTDHLRSP